MAIAMVDPSCRADNIVRNGRTALPNLENEQKMRKISPESAALLREKGN